MKTKRKSSYDDRQERYFMIGKPMKRVCLVCRKAGHLQYMCCNRITYVLGYTLRAPRAEAGRGKWKKFEFLLWKYTYNKELRIQNLALDNQEQM